MTKRERKKMIKTICGHIHRDVSGARIAVMGSYDDTLLSRLDRLEAAAYATVFFYLERK